MSKTYKIVIPYMENGISEADLAEIRDKVEALDKSASLLYFDIYKPFSKWLTPLLDEKTIVWPLHGLPVEFSRGLVDFKCVVFDNSAIHKVQELKALDAGQIAVPAWVQLRRDLELSKEKFGDLVLIKSTGRDASHGKGIFLYNRVDVQEEANALCTQMAALGKSQPIIQRFIKTGDRPSHYRVVTFMGEPILAHKTVATHNTPIAAPTNKMEIAAKATSNAGDIERFFVKEPEILNASKEVAKVFADRPLLGQDFIRDEKTGEIFVLEVNMGNVWSFSSKGNSRTQSLLGPDKMKAQFGASDIVAKRMVEEARRVLRIKA